MKYSVLICCLIFLSLNLQGQGIYNNGGTIILNGSIYCYIDGDNNGAYFNSDYGGVRNGEIDGTGFLILEGNWTNNAANNVFITPATLVTTVFKGTTTQTIRGITTSFENFTVNNTIASGLAVSLDTTATVSGTLAFTDGVVTTGTDTMILTNTSSSSLLPAVPTNASYINGNFTRYVASNTSTYSFPCGNGTASANFYLAELINNNLTGISYITAKFGALTGHNDLDLDVTEQTTAYYSVAAEGVWYIIPNAAPTGGNYDLKCYIANIAGLSNNMFSILKRPDGSPTAADWVCTPCGFCPSPPAAPNTCTSGEPGINENGGLGRILTDGYAQRYGISSFSQFGIGKSVAPLPIELLYFSAVCNNNKVILEWTTASESNNDYFTVEKSYDALDFEAVGKIPGAGTSSQLINYSYKDEGAELVYYRLKQTDYDGKYTHSNWIAVNCVSEKLKVLVTPNPATDHLKVNITGSTGTQSTLSIFDQTGRVVYEKRSAPNGSAQGGLGLSGEFEIDVSGFNSGLYYFLFVTDEGVFINKFAKE